MRKTVRLFVRPAALLLALLLAAGAALGENYRIAEENGPLFRQLFSQLKSAYETPAEGDSAGIADTLEKIRGVNRDDYDIAKAVADHWARVYLDRHYRMFIYRGEKTAVTLERSDPPIGEKHAIVVLGYRLENGEMTPELKGRCRAAAAMARSYPDAILVCSGGATGDNNPERHTEAGRMKAYLSRECGIDASRIYTDDRARTTLENAENTFEILRENGIRTYTVVTSTYHQRWGQVLYNAMSAIYEKKYGYSAQLVANYSYKIEPEEKSYRNDADIALGQLSSMLSVPRK